MSTIRKRGNRWQVQLRRAGHPPVSDSFLSRKDAEAWARQMSFAICSGLARVSDFCLVL